jgi:hypothetical protein
MPGEFARLKAMLKELLHEWLGIRQGNHTITDVTWRQHAKIAS